MFQGDKPHTQPARRPIYDDDRSPVVLALTAEVGADLIVRYGLGVLFLIFALEGALIGKLIPTRTILFASVLVLGTTIFNLVPVALAAVLGATIGQLLLFVLIRYTAFEYESLESVGIDESHVTRAAGWFDRWGLPAVAVANILPIARGSMTIPAAASHKSVVQFAAVSLSGSVIYIVTLVVIADGIVTVLPI